MAERKNFGVLTDALDAPDLIEIQLNSYRDFLQQDREVTSRGFLTRSLIRIYKSLGGGWTPELPAFQICSTSLVVFPSSEGELRRAGKDHG